MCTSCFTYITIHFSATWVFWISQFDWNTIGK